MKRIRTAQSRAADARAAVAEFHAGVAQPDMALVVFFCSSAYDLPALADELNKRFAGVPVVGCTTAGEIGPGGYLGQSLSGASFPTGDGVAVTGRIDGLAQFVIAEGESFAQDLLQRLEAVAPVADAGNTFGFLLIDGLALREEPVTHALQGGLGRIQLIGGSAGDDLKFARTRVFHDGAFRTDCAALALVNTSIPFRIMRTQHFVSGDERMVVTDVDAARRIVREINGLPAVEEYARIVGVEPACLDSSHFAACPVVVIIDGTEYVRSIQKVNPDGSLTFYCAIDEGVVLRVAHGENMLGNLEAAFARLRGELGGIQAALVCDCILRSLEADRSGIKAAVGEVFRRHNAVGFATYGEQVGGVHVNQTLTGIVFGGGSDDA